MLEPWRATCMQVITHVVNDLSSREDAMAMVHKTLDRWERLIEFAVGRGGGSVKQLVLFPEFALTGYPMGESAAEWIEKACIEIPGPETERLQRTAQRLGIHIGANSYERDPEWPGRYFNCCYLIDPSGDVVLKYKRINTVHSPSPHDFMDRYFERYGIEGAFPVANTALGKIGMIPCGEIMYPEPSRALMFRGAEVILHPTSDHGVSDFNAWESAKRVRASENMVYLVSSNSGGTVGSPPANTHVGHSKIIDFNGQVLINNFGQGESLAATTLIDLTPARRARLEVGALNRLGRQRNEMYAPLYQQAAFYPPNSFLNEAMSSKAKISGIMRETLDRLVAAGIITPP